MLVLYVGTDNLIEWDGLRRAADNAYVNTATTTFTVKDDDNVALSGATAVAMPYVVASNGRYQGTLPSTVTLSAGSKYWLEVTALYGSAVGFRRIQCYADYEGEI